MNGEDIENGWSLFIPPICFGVYSGSAVRKSDLIKDDIRNCVEDKQLCGLQVYSDEC